jgi:hypothetical protein
LSATSLSSSFIGAIIAKITLAATAHIMIVKPDGMKLSAGIYLKQQLKTPSMTLLRKQQAQLLSRLHSL